MPFRFAMEQIFEWWRRRRETRRLIGPDDAAHNRAVKLIAEQGRELEKANERIAFLEQQVDRARDGLFVRVEEAEKHFDLKWSKIEDDYTKCHEERLQSIQIINTLKEQMAQLSRQLNTLRCDLKLTTEKVESHGAEVAQVRQQVQETVEKIEDTAGKVEAMKDTGASGTSLHGGSS